MPKNEVSDPITDQEMAFALLVLSGAMTDRQAAEAVGLNPDSAAYTKAKPSVRAYMLEHPAAVQQQPLQQQADLSRRAVEQLRRLSPDREQVLARLWELAHLSPEMTRNSITGQVKAISMIVAMQNFIPDRRALSSERKSTPPPVLQEDSPAEPAPARPGVPWGAVGQAPPDPGPSQSTFAHRFNPSEAHPPVALFTSVPDLGIPFPIKETPLNPFVRPR